MDPDVPVTEGCWMDPKRLGSLGDNLNIPAFTLPETNSSHLKMDGFEFYFQFGDALF